MKKENKKNMPLSGTTNSLKILKDKKLYLSPYQSDYKDIVRKRLERHYTQIKNGEKSRLTREEVYLMEDILKRNVYYQPRAYSLNFRRK